MQITKKTIEYTQANLCSKICPKIYKACYLVSKEYSFEEQWHNIAGCPLVVAWRFKN